MQQNDEDIVKKRFREGRFYAFLSRSEVKA
jgi:hypothetical protein